MCIDNEIAIVAKTEKKVIGFATGSISKALPFKTFKYVAHLHNIFVLDLYRGNKVGHDLIMQFKKIAKESGVKRIHTDSDYDEHLLKFYDSLGFEITGVNYQLKV